MKLNRLVHLLAVLACLVLPQLARGQDFSLVAGDWKGDWSGSGEQGWIGVTIQNNGSLTGFVTSRSRGTSDACTGQLQPNGTVAIVVGEGSRRREVAGIAKFAARAISGQAAFQQSGRSVAVKFSLKRAASGDFLAGSNFAGVWSGSWSTGITKGLIRVVIDADGVVTANLVNSTYGNTGQLTGTIIRAGVLSGEGETVINGSDEVETYEFVGDFRTSRDSLSGKIFVAQSLGPAVAATFSLKRETSQPFEGSWFGTVKVDGVAVDVQFDVSADGSGLLTVYDSMGEIYGTIELLVLANGSFAGTDPEGGIHTGTLRKSGLRVSGSGLEVAEGGKTRYSIQLVRTY